MRWLRKTLANLYAERAALEARMAQVQREIDQLKTT